LQLTLAVSMSYVSFFSDYFFILTVCIHIIPLALLGNTVVSLRRCGLEQTPGFINNIRACSCKAYANATVQYTRCTECCLIFVAPMSCTHLDVIYRVTDENTCIVHFIQKILSVVTISLYRELYRNSTRKFSSSYRQNTCVTKTN
jgi:hypothetical protein